MEISLLIDFIKGLFTNPVTRWVIIILTLYIWVVQGIGFLVRRGFKMLFHKKVEGKKQTQQEKPMTATKKASPVENKINSEGYLELK
ncbi:MAG: hypothetical protein DRP93_08625 [Candidatus Neomarinimicrobiota bacterium]|nr:MAG: hypothetical protein DRP93_08625 [Candidatus Neomarinimicrobiota bacterium]